jgi:hypothetical protein
MKKALPPLDLNRLREPEFSHAEALEITGLTADTLLTWHKRGVVANTGGVKAMGRGHRRKYSVADLAYLSVLKHLSPRMPLPFAVAVAADAQMAVIKTYDMMRFREGLDEIDAMPGVSLITYEDATGQIRFDLIADREEKGLPTWPAGGIATWMRQYGICSVTVIDMTTVTLTLFGRIGIIKERKGQ